MELTEKYVKFLNTGTYGIRKSKGNDSWDMFLNHDSSKIIAICDEGHVANLMLVLNGHIPVRKKNTES